MLVYKNMVRFYKCIALSEFFAINCHHAMKSVRLFQ